MTDDHGYLLDLAAAGSRDVHLAGGKGAGLAELVAAGVRVPAGCVVTTTANRRVVDALDPSGDLRRAIGALDPADTPGLSAATAAFRDRIVAAPLPPEVERAVRDGYARLAARVGAQPAVAVRSSATAEDGAGASFAGLQHTYLSVTGADAVLAQVRRCWASLYSVESVSYRLVRGVPEAGLAMAVVVQVMVEARCSGVMFTRSPITGDPSTVVVEASWGLGSAVVSGLVTPDHWVVDKATGEVVRSVISRKLRRHRADPVTGTVVDEQMPPHLQGEPSLTRAQLGDLVEVGLAAERHHGRAQDVEWAIGDAAPDGDAPGAGLFLLQSRPASAGPGPGRILPAAAEGARRHGDGAAAGGVR